MTQFKSFLLFLVAMVAGFFSSCSSEESVVEAQDAQVANTRAVGVKTPKLTVYIETNDVNPLNAGEYYFTGTNPMEEVIDHVILFASNIRGTATTAQLYHNPNQSHILANASTLIAPLQAKGIKVLLGLLGDHTGVGFANMNAAQRESFAQAIKTCVETYGLDGVDFDDEYAEYGKIPGMAAPTSANFGLLIQRVRALLPGKLVTAFDYGYTYGFNAATLNALDYMWPDFGCSPTPPTGFANSKWAKLAVNSSFSTQGAVESCASNYAGYGAVMYFNMRETDSSAKFNWFSSRVWGGKTVSWTETTHPKNY